MFRQPLSQLSCVTYVEFAVVELEDVDEEAVGAFIGLLPSFRMLDLMQGFLAVPVNDYFGA